MFRLIRVKLQMENEVECEVGACRVAELLPKNKDNIVGLENTKNFFLKVSWSQKRLMLDHLHTKVWKRRSLSFWTLSNDNLSNILDRVKK